MNQKEGWDAGLQSRPRGVIRKNSTPKNGQAPAVTFEVTPQRKYSYVDGQVSASKPLQLLDLNLNRPPPLSLKSRTEFTERKTGISRNNAGQQNERVELRVGRKEERARCYLGSGQNETRIQELRQKYLSREYIQQFDQQLELKHRAIKKVIEEQMKPQLRHRQTLVLPQSLSQTLPLASTRDQSVQTTDISTAKCLLDKALQTIGITLSKAHLIQTQKLRQQGKQLPIQRAKQSGSQATRQQVRPPQFRFQSGRSQSRPRPNPALRESQKWERGNSCKAKRSQPSQLICQDFKRAKANPGASERHFQEESVALPFSFEQREIVKARKLQLQAKYKRTSRRSKFLQEEGLSAKRLIEEGEFDSVAKHYQKLRNALKSDVPKEDKKELLDKLAHQVVLDRELRSLVAPFQKNPEYVQLKTRLLDKYGLQENRYWIQGQELEGVSAKQFEVKSAASKIYELVDRVDKHWCWEVRNQFAGEVVRAVFREVDLGGKRRVEPEELVRQLNLCGHEFRCLDMLRLFRRISSQRSILEEDFVRTLSK